METPYKHLIEAVSSDARDVVMYANFDQDNRITEMTDEYPIDDIPMHGTLYEAVNNLHIAISNFGISVEEAVLGLFGSTQ